MAYRTTMNTTRQHEEALEIFIPEGGGTVILALTAASDDELHNETAGSPIRRIPRPDTMNGRPVRSDHQGSTPLAGAAARDPNR